MTEVADPVQMSEIVEPAPAPQLPAVRQERKPSTKRALGKDAAPAPAAFPPRLAAAIIRITREIGSIQKLGTNEFQRYKYTRWEDILDKLSPLLADIGIIITQSEIRRDIIETNEKGSVLAIVYNMSLINEHGDQWPGVEWTGMARLRDAKGVQDDKAVLKCQTQAEKSFVLKLFKIRSDDGMDDNDQHSTLPKKDARDIYQKLQAEIDGAQSLVELGTWGKENSERIHVLPRDWQQILRDRFNEKRHDLENQSRGFDRYTGEVWAKETEDENSGDVVSAPTSPPAAADPIASPTAAATLTKEHELLLSLARKSARQGEAYFDRWLKVQSTEARAFLGEIMSQLEALFPK